MKKTVLALAAVALMGLGLSGCTRAISNMQTLISDDCGATWKEVPVGNVVPARVGWCALKVTIPGFPMSGEAGFRTSFANRVLVNTNIGYEYQITDGKLFLSEARYLGRQNSEGDGEANSADRYESAENTIINRRIREVVSTVLNQTDIVSFDQAKLDDELLEKINQNLKSRGVQLLSMQFVVTPDEQTRQAMDVASARQVYGSIGLQDLGDRLMVARAGASRVSVTQSAPTGQGQQD